MTILGAVFAFITFVSVNLNIAWPDCPPWVTILLGALLSTKDILLGKSHPGTNESSQPPRTSTPTLP
jgi:hypothetical protein